MNNYCFNCMKPLGSSAVCQYCGNNNNAVVSAPYHLPPGTILNERYLLGRVLGEGGFGITYIGLDLTLAKRIAVKEFYPSGAANRTATVSNEVIVTQGKEPFFSKGVDRFLFEAKSVAAFSEEDGIVDVLDYFQANKTAYIVMEYLEGENLKQYIKRNGPFRTDDLIRLMLPVMKSLKAIHAKGVIHRDISPDNIMFTTSGKLKLMDFGSARYYTNEERQMSVVLKQGYGPEEQYRRNGRQGPFTDVYALCATIYTCITGRVPIESLDRLQNDTLVPPSRLGADISPAQEAALMHGLAPLAENRCPDMDSLMREFTAPQNENPTMNANSYADNYQNRQPFYQNQQPYQQQAYQQPQNNYPANGWGQPQFYGQQGYGYTQQPQKSSAPLIVAIVITAAAILIVGGIILFVFLSGQNNQSNEPAATLQTSTAVTTDTQVSTQPSQSDHITAETSTSAATPPTEPSSEPQETTKPTSTMTKSEIDARISIISDDYLKTIKYIDAQTKKSGYAVTKTSDNYMWIASPDTSMVDDDAYKSWYFYDNNGKVYFIYEHTAQGYFRYYVYNDEIIRYTVGHQDEHQESFDHNDSNIPSSAKDRITSAYTALDTVLK